MLGQETALQGNHSRVPTLLSPDILIWAVYGDEDLCQGVVWDRVERAEEPTAPGTLQLEMACQGNPGKAQALLLLQHSNLNHPQ